MQRDNRLSWHLICVKGEMRRCHDRDNGKPISFRRPSVEGTVMKKKASVHAVGQAFEEEVARLYEALGYKVQRNVRLAGQQIDLLLTKMMSGAGMAKIVVECKYRSQGSVENQEVFDFISMFKAIMEPFRLTAGVMVTNARYTADAKSAIQGSPHIWLRTVQDLEDEIFGGIPR